MGRDELASCGVVLGFWADTGARAVARWRKWHILPPTTVYAAYPGKDQPGLCHPHALWATDLASTIWSIKPCRAASAIAICCDPTLRYSGAD